MEQREDVTIDLDSDVTAPAVARRFVEDHSDHLPAELVADAELLVTELVTNAVKHGRPQISVRVRLDPPMMGVLVSDGSLAAPTTDVHPPASTSGGGRGLLIVDRVSSQWGVLPHPDDPGKTVWFELTARAY